MAGVGSKGGSQTVTQQGDPWLQNQVRALSTQAGGYNPQAYRGNRTAGFGTDWTTGAQQLRDASANYGGAINEAQQMVRDNSGPAPTFAGSDISQYMNPYTSNVIDQSNMDLNRARQLGIQSDAAQAASAGAFGGSRHGVAEAETNRGFADAAARNSAQLRDQGFNTASGLLTGDLNRQMQGRQLGLQSAGLLTDIAGQGFQGADRMLGLGQAEQTQAQGGLDRKYEDFLRNQGLPLQQIMARLGVLGAYPGNSSQTQPTNSNWLSGLLGAGATAAGMAFGGPPGAAAASQVAGGGGGSGKAGW